MKQSALWSKTLAWFLLASRTTCAHNYDHPWTWDAQCQDKRKHKLQQEIAIRLKGKKKIPTKVVRHWHHHSHRDCEICILGDAQNSPEQGLSNLTQLDLLW